jgi:hypothetical protein
MKQEFKEKRLFGRINCANEGKYYLIDNSSGNFLCKDIAPRGIGIFSEKYFNANEKILLQISVKNDSLLVEGRVHWCKKETAGYRVGVEFNKSFLAPLSSFRE